MTIRSSSSSSSIIIIIIIIIIISIVLFLLSIINPKSILNHTSSSQNSSNTHYPPGFLATLLPLSSIPGNSNFPHHFIIRFQDRFQAGRYQATRAYLRDFWGVLWSAFFRFFFEKNQVLPIFMGEMFQRRLLSEIGAFNW